jgi:hypothetical protein
MLELGLLPGDLTIQVRESLSEPVRSGRDPPDDRLTGLGALPSLTRCRTLTWSACACCSKILVTSAAAARIRARRPCPSASVAGSRSPSAGR